ncbi:hypothetical protein ACP70R_037189 [Stipagrostis hirtigluma subsp. patula]
MSDPFYPSIGGGFPVSDSAPPPPPRYSDYEVDLIAARYADPRPPYPPPVEVGYFDAHVGDRRSAEVLNRQSFMGSHSNIGQSEALYSTNTMVKRPRLESSLPIYPQRPGAKDCAFYMKTRTCKYGEACIFDHPQWVPEGGVPNWKEAPNVEDSYPERPGEPDCPFFSKNSKCKFKSKCKYNHPKKKANTSEAGTDNDPPIADSTILPVRPFEPVCSFYAKTGKCKFGAKCKFNHPKDTETPKDIETPAVAGKETIYTAAIDATLHAHPALSSVPAKTQASPAPAEAHNAKGLPIRPGEVDCAFYMKTGSCKYGSICRFNHPDRPVLDIAFMAPLGQTIFPTPVANFMQSFDFHAPHVPVEPEPIIYPQRPGETVCDFYMKTGQCKYKDKCKFHHPIDRSAPGSNGNLDSLQPVELTLAGLPRRQEAKVCAFYMKTGTCQFGVHCKFDHPPPEEAISKLQATGKEGESKDQGPS